MLLTVVAVLRILPIECLIVTASFSSVAIFLHLCEWQQCLASLNFQIFEGNRCYNLKELCMIKVKVMMSPK